MPLEGKLGSFNFSHETIVTDDHPGVLRSLFMDDTVTAKLPTGTILKVTAAKKEEDSSGETQTQSETSRTENTDTGAVYAVCSEADTPAAVLVEDFNPDEKTYATCLVHGTVKAEFLQVSGQKPTLAMLDKLMAAGIFTV